MQQRSFSISAGSAPRDESCASNPDGTILQRNPEQGKSNGGSIMLKKGVVLAGASLLLLCTSGAATAQMRSGARAVLQACKPDIAQFCSQVPPGQGRIKACMKEHLRELSEPCKEGLFQAWLKE
jgi:Cysteine rich repeat